MSQTPVSANCKKHRLHQLFAINPKVESQLITIVSKWVYWSSESVDSPGNRESHLSIQDAQTAHLDSKRFDAWDRYDVTPTVWLMDRDRHVTIDVPTAEKLSPYKYDASSSHGSVSHKFAIGDDIFFNINMEIQEIIWFNSYDEKLLYCYISW